jgi:retron-type reverse transcriptase
MVLQSIYEPEFKKLNSNYGFRPGYGVHDAIQTIKTKAKSMKYAIEADVQGAFDNVDFDILLTILRKKISDEKFLKLIHYSLKCGINYSNQFEESKLGTTQGSIVSPMLYNIYFHEFDKFDKFVYF